MIRTLQAIATLTLVAGCASSNVMRLDAEVRPAIAPENVEFLLDEPTRTYKAVGLIEVSDDGWGLSLDALRKKLGEEAGKIGGEAVILSRRNTEGDAVLIPIGAMWYAGSVETSRLVGKVVVFLPPE